MIIIINNNKCAFVGVDNYKHFVIGVSVGYGLCFARRKNRILILIQTNVILLMQLSRLFKISP
jgi:hypothetical protein